MMTLLPVLLLRGRQNRMDHFVQNRPSLLGRYEAFSLRRPVWILLLCVAITVAAAWQARRVYFDYNLLNMQSRDLPAVALSRKLIESNSRSVLFAALVVDSLEEALSYEQRLRALPTVGSVNFGGIDQLSNYLTEDQSAKLSLVKEVQAAIRGVSFVAPDRSVVPIDQLAAVLYSLGGYMGAAAEEAGKEDPAIAAQLLEIKAAILELTRRMYDANTLRPGEKLAAFQERLLADIRETFDAIHRQDSSSPLRVEDLPPSLRERFRGVTGRYVLQIYPKEDVWDRANQGRFVNELRTVAPQVTGTPVGQWEYTSLLVDSYISAALYALAGIVVLVTLHFRRVTWVLLSLLPVLIGAVWTAGYMGLTGLPLNPANIMTLPLVVGIGVTNGIQIMNRYAETGAPTMLTVSTGKAVIVSGLTTIAGFASLILGKHQGIQSLGLVMSVGVTTCMVAALAMLPALLHLLYGAGQPKEKPSGNMSSTLGLEEPR
jgi:predicted RND superfamily exporter protein